MIRAVLFDLDGVIRHFDPAYVVAIEERYRLESGTLDRVAFSHELLARVTTGRIGRHEWIEHIGQAVAHPAAAAEWGRQPWVFDEPVLELVEELRGLGLTTAILTNGTDSIGSELAGSRVEESIDAVFNSAEIGYAKPDPRAFEHVLNTLGVAAESVFFTDDSSSKLSGAAALGIKAHLYLGVETLRVALRAVGIPC